MNIGMSRAVSGCVVQQERLNEASLNLANAATTGFKTAALGLVSNNNLVQVREKVIDFSEGAKQATNNKLDLALEGSGFFTVQTNQGPAYTRKGNFSLNQDGLLVTQEGLPVLGQRGTIRIKGHDLTISSDGTIFVDGQEAEKLRLADFAKPYPLSTTSGTLFFSKNQTALEQPAKGTIVRQGQIELSTTNLMREMAKLIQISTNFESCQKVIQTVDELDQKIINETGKV